MRWMLAMLLVAGVALCASDGAWFPYPNLAGCAMVALFAWMVRHDPDYLDNETGYGDW